IVDMPIAKIQATINENLVGCQLMASYDLTDEETREVREYCAAHGRSTPRGRSGWPKFVCAYPGYVPRSLKDGEDEDCKRRLAEALDVCLWLSELLEQETKKSLGFQPGLEPDTLVPLIEWAPEGKYRLGVHSLPDSPLLPEVTGYNEVMAEKLRRMKKTSGTWLVDVFNIPVPINDEDDSDDNALFFPLMSLAMAGEEPYINMCRPGEGSDRQLLDDMIQLFLEHGRPLQIITVTERAYRICAPLGRRSGIKTVLYENKDTDYYDMLMEEESAIIEDMLSPDDDLPGVIDGLTDGETAELVGLINNMVDFSDVSDDFLELLLEVAMENGEKIDLAHLHKLQQEAEKRFI
ncbi:MAG: hypothetical protein LUH42_01545, partial [Oscillospiraceae bacterium]|nr:hypothetical protein [Oscillospiraceae bacterium]